MMFLLLVFAVVFVVLIMVTSTTRAFRMKLSSYANGLYFMFVSDDLPKSFKCSNYMWMQTSKPQKHQRVIRVVFIRHGQSVWNSLFNTYGLFWPLRVVKAIFLEIVYFFKDPFNSVFIDSPLTSKGIKEAQELAQFLRMSKGKISFDPNNSLVVCSNLRRAMETAVICMSSRIAVTKEKIVVDSSLQEASRNIDAQTLSTERGKIVFYKIAGLNTPQQVSATFDARLNAGNKTPKVNVYGRMDDFISHLFGGSGQYFYIPASRPELGNEQLKEVIVVGHSSFFRCFFRRFLPSLSSHIAKEKKLQNCGVVAFDIIQNETTGEIFIDESSINVFYKGFVKR